VAHARSRTRRGALTAALLAAALFAAGCGSSDTGATGADGEKTIRIANTSSTQPTFVATKYGVLKYGPDFGLKMSVGDWKTFDSHAVGTQTVLSGQADVVAGSFVSDMVLAEKGQKFKAFCPYISNDDFVLVGANGVTSVSQLFEPGRRIAIDSPGGAGAIILNAILAASGEKRTVADIENAQILESSGLRLSAYAAGKVDATVVHKLQYNSAESKVKQPTIIASLYESVPVFVKEVHAAPAKWLDENLDTAAAYCAGVIKGMRELKQDAALFKEAVDKYAEDKPDSQADLDEVYGLVQKYDFWPEDGGLNEKNVQFMGEVAVQSGLLKSVPKFEDVVDPRPIEMALKMLAEQK
jgi:ABC-type nitrate/sulfonate/bicarbonate transport system substrate-binding protein